MIMIALLIDLKRVCINFDLWSSDLHSVLITKRLFEKVFGYILEKPFLITYIRSS